MLPAGRLPAGKHLPLVVAEKNQVRRAGLFAALVADALAALLGGSLATVELQRTQAQVTAVGSHQTYPQVLPTPVGSPTGEVAVDGLPGVGRSPKELPGGQLPPLATGFEAVQNGFNDLAVRHFGRNSPLGFTQMWHNERFNRSFAVRRAVEHGASPVLVVWSLQNSVTHAIAFPQP